MRILSPFWILIVLVLGLFVVWGVTLAVEKSTPAPVSPAAPMPPLLSRLVRPNDAWLQAYPQESVEKVTLYYNLRLCLEKIDKLQKQVAELQKNMIVSLVDPNVAKK